MKCTILIAAEQIIVDYQSKRISAINILEDFVAQSMPIALHFMLLVGIEREGDDPNNGGFNLEIKNNDKELFKRVDNIDFPTGHNVTKNVTNFGTVIISEPGVLSFKISYEGKILKELDIKVMTLTTSQPIIAELVQLAAPQA